MVDNSTEQAGLFSISDSVSRDRSAQSVHYRDIKRMVYKPQKHRRKQLAIQQVRNNISLMSLVCATAVMLQYRAVQPKLSNLRSQITQLGVRKNLLTLNLTGDLTINYNFYTRQVWFIMNKLSFNILMAKMFFNVFIPFCVFAVFGKVKNSRCLCMYLARYNKSIYGIFEFLKFF